MKNFLFKKNKYLVSFSLGSVLSLILPPYSYTALGFLIFPTLLYLLFANRDQTRKSIFYIGFLFGYGYFLFSLYWITYSLNFDDNLAILKPLTLVVLPSVIAIFYGLASMLIQKTITNNFYFIVVFSVTLSTLDFLRGNLFFDFPWNLFAYTWSWSLESLQILGFVGTYSLNLFTIFIFCLPFLVLKHFHYKKLFIVISSIAFILCLNFFFGQSTINNNNLKRIPNFKVVLLQPNQKIIDLTLANNEEHYVNRLINISKPKMYKDTQALFVWPEGILSNLDNSKNYKKLFYDNFSNNHNIVLGSVRYEGNKFYNSLVLLNNQAEILSSYDKINLVPFGEVIPFYNVLEKINLKKITFGYGSFSKGEKRNPVTLNINNIKFLPLICYEIIFSGSIDTEQKEYDFILNISEDGWFNRSIGTIQHFVHSKYRAIEQGKQVVRSTNQGLTSSILPNGRLAKTTDFSNQSSIVVDIYKLNKKTLFSEFENTIFYLLTFISCIFIFLFRKNNE